MSDPRIWGTDLWASMHRVSLAYPLARPSTAQRSAARNFFAAIGQLLPCVGCRMHYMDHFNKTFSSATTQSRGALARWVYELHEAVNKRLDKPTGRVKFEDLPRLYNTYPDRYISIDGKELLEEPRFTTLANDFEGASAPIERSKAVQNATTVYDALALTNQAEAEAAIDNMARNTSLFWIGVVLLALLSVVTVLVAVKVARKRDQTHLQEQRDVAVRRQRVKITDSV